jgi:GDP-D-mannose dehydratase
VVSLCGVSCALPYSSDVDAWYILVFSIKHRIDHLYHDQHEEKLSLTLHYGDMTDAMNLTRIIQEVQPDEIYNLASHVPSLFLHLSCQGTVYLEALKQF